MSDKNPKAHYSADFSHRVDMNAFTGTITFADNAEGDTKVPTVSITLPVPEMINLASAIYKTVSRKDYLKHIEESYEEVLALGRALQESKTDKQDEA